jgi:hypothetical protein
MIKDDTKDQIPLFELPVPVKSDKPATAATAASEETAHKTSAPRKKTSPEKVSHKLISRETKHRGSPRATAAKNRTARPAPAPVPEGDVRLTANIREDLHLKLKIVAATRRTTIGELIEELVERHL